MLYFFRLEQTSKNQNHTIYCLGLINLLFKDFKETEIVPDQIHIDIAYACIKDHYIFVEYEKYCKMEYFIGDIRVFSEQKECPNITYRGATA